MKKFPKPTPCCPPPSDTAFAVPQGGGHGDIIFQQNHKFLPKIQKQGLHTRKNSVGAESPRKIQISFLFLQWQHAAYQSLFIFRSLACDQVDNPSILIDPMARGCLLFTRVLHDRKFPCPPPCPTEWDREGDYRGWVSTQFFQLT